MSSLREIRKARARAYILAHPDQSKREQAQGAEVSETMIARIRRDLILEGDLTPSRKALLEPPGRPLAASPDASDTESKPRGRDGLLDHAALTAMADIADAAEGDLDDDEEVQRRLLRQCLHFAFNPKLHPDTRMTASQMWSKLRDQARSKNLGPGAPKTFEDAVTRLASLMEACGPQVTLAAVNVVFKVEESPGGEATDEQAAAALGTAPAPGAA